MQSVIDKIMSFSKNGWGDDNNASDGIDKVLITMEGYTSHNEGRKMLTKHIDSTHLNKSAKNSLRAFEAKKKNNQAFVFAPKIHNPYEKKEEWRPASPRQAVPHDQQQNDDTSGSATCHRPDNHQKCTISDTNMRKEQKLKETHKNRGSLYADFVKVPKNDHHNSLHTLKNVAQVIGAATHMCDHTVHHHDKKANRSHHRTRVDEAAKRLDVYDTSDLKVEPPHWHLNIRGLRDFDMTSKKVNIAEIEAEIKKSKGY
jgi:hypothetical protein